MSDGRRSRCPICYALDLFGDRWTLLVLRDAILHGKRHFNEFLASGEGIASNILADRLRRLEEGGLMHRMRDPGDKRQYIYSVTEKGAGLTRALMEIALWGAKHDADTGAPDGFIAAYERDPESYVSEILAELDRTATGSDG